MRPLAAALLWLVSVTGMVRADGEVLPTWTRPLTPPDWVPPLDRLQDSLQVSDDGASVLVTYVGWLWRFQASATGATIQSQLLSTGSSQASRGRVIPGTNNLAIASFIDSGDFTGGSCVLAQLDANAALRWYYQAPEPFEAYQLCASAQALPDGTLVSASYNRVQRLTAEGEVAWIRPLLLVGGSSRSFDLLTRTASGRLLVSGRASIDGAWRHFVWVLDGQTGAELDLHWSAPASTTLAARNLADGGVELVGNTEPHVEAIVRRYDADGAPVSQASVPLQMSQMRLARPHASGFILAGQYDAGHSTVAWLDGARLRWQSPPLDPPSDARFALLASAAAGEVAVATPDGIQRIDANGHPLPIQPLAAPGLYPLAVAYARNGALWVWNQDYAFYPQELSLSRYDSASGPPASTQRIAVQVGQGSLLALDADADGSVRALGALHSRDPLALDGRLLAHTVSASGQLLADFDAPRPSGDYLRAFATQGGWMVLVGDFFGPRTLQALDRAGETLWQRTLIGNDGFECDRGSRCVLRFSGAQPRLEHIDFDGTVLGMQTTEIVPVALRDRQALLGASYDMNAPAATLWSLDGLPAIRRAQAPGGDGLYRYSSAGLLKSETGAIRLWGDGQVLWTLPQSLPLYALSSRHDVLQLVSRPEDKSLLHLRTVALASGSTLRQSTLPPGYTELGDRYPANWSDPEGPAFDAWDGRRDWVLARRSFDTPTDLLSTAADGQWQRIALQRPPIALRALPGDAAVVVRPSGTAFAPSLALERYDLPLFSDGFEEAAAR